MSNQKTRYFVGICYSEAALSDVILAFYHKCKFSLAVSPLHAPCSDDSETELKSHYHYIIRTEFPRTESSINTLKDHFISCSEVTKLFSCNSPVAYTRYLVHLDNPEKEQFANGLDEVKQMGIYDFVEKALSEASSNPLIRIIDILDEHKEICNMRQLIKYISSIQDLDSLKFLSSHSYLVSTLLIGR